MQKTLLPARQIALFCACVLPVYKLVELPSVLAQFSKGSILLPALFQYALQFGVLFALLYVCKNGEQPLLFRLQNRLGKWLYLFALLYGVFFLTFALLPILDLEKFTYAVFYDTAPTTFTFGVFFLLCAFIACKGLRTVGRFADVALFLFPISLFALTAMSFAVCDLSSLLPLTGMPLAKFISSLKYTALPFSDVVLLLPMLLVLDYKKGDTRKICIGYGVGIAFTLLFLAVFYGVFSTTAQKEHYAFAKIAQYFPALKVLGRMDLIFVYLICIVLFFFTSLPVLYTVRCVKTVFPKLSTAILSGTLSLGLFFFTLFCNKYYDGIYNVFGNVLFPVFWLFGLILPLSSLFFIGGKSREKHTSTQ